MTEPKELDAEAKLASIKERLWEELEDMDHEASEMLQEMGLDSDEVRDRSMGAFSEAVEKRDMSLWANLPAVYGAYGSFNLGGGLLRRYLEKGPQCVEDGEDYYSELVGSLKAAACAFGALSTVYAIETGKPSGLVRDMLGKGVSALARRGADGTHAENREIAERIKDWWRETGRHQYKSIDAAATAAARIEPVSVRTAQKHISAAAKELRSAGKA